MTKVLCGPALSTLAQMPASAECVVPDYITTTQRYPMACIPHTDHVSNKEIGRETRQSPGSYYITTRRLRLCDHTAGVGLALSSWQAVSFAKLFVQQPNAIPSSHRSDHAFNKHLCHFSKENKQLGFGNKQRRHVQHVRPNRVPHKKGAPTRGQ